VGAGTKVRRGSGTEVGGSGLPCRGQEAPQCALHGV
jgi:hypothetical protein